MFFQECECKNPSVGCYDEVWEDGNCDHYMNNKLCNFDTKGDRSDCCKKESDWKHCHDCMKSDDFNGCTKKKNDVKKEKEKLCIKDVQNDAFCHDENNNAECGFDGGACCLHLDPKKGWNFYCKVC